MKTNKRSAAAGKKGRQRTAASRPPAPSLSRPRPARDAKATFLIVCEGEATEPSYFRHFRLPSAEVRAVGEGCNTISLVNKAIQWMKQAPYDQVWCVFDKDDYPDSQFNEAVRLAERAGIRPAYSNQAFEYWMLLHFHPHQGSALHRKDCIRLIHSALRELGFPFDGADKRISKELFGLMEGREAPGGPSRMMRAIQRARQIHEACRHLSPAAAESSTTVFQLVEALLQHR